MAVVKSASEIFPQGQGMVVRPTGDEGHWVVREPMKLPSCEK